MAAPPDQNQNNSVFFAPVSTLTVPHAALLLRAAIFLLWGHNDPRGIAALVDWRAQY